MRKDVKDDPPWIGPRPSGRLPVEQSQFIVNAFGRATSTYPHANSGHTLLLLLLLLLPLLLLCRQISQHPIDGRHLKTNQRN